MDYKEYKISEIIDMVGASKATIYNKINSLRDLLRSHTNIRKGILYIDLEGVEIIKKSIGFSKEQLEKQDNSIDSNDSVFLETLEINKKYIESLESQIETLKIDNEFLKDYLTKQLDEKDKQLSNKDELLRNFQVLLKNEQDNNIKLLENNTKLLEDKSKGSLWDKLFKNSKDK